MSSCTHLLAVLQREIPPRIHARIIRYTQRLAITIAESQRADWTNELQPLRMISHVQRRVLRKEASTTMEPTALDSRICRAEHEQLWHNTLRHIQKRDHIAITSQRGLDRQAHKLRISRGLPRLLGKAQSASHACLESRLMPRSALCAPMKHHNHHIPDHYVDHRHAARRFVTR